MNGWMGRMDGGRRDGGRKGRTYHNLMTTRNEHDVDGLVLAYYTQVLLLFPLQSFIQQVLFNFCLS